jgi:hypothetical protein
MTKDYPSHFSLDVNWFQGRMKFENLAFSCKNVMHVQAQKYLEPIEKLRRRDTTGKVWRFGQGKKCSLL